MFHRRNHDEPRVFLYGMHRCQLGGDVPQDGQFGRLYPANYSREPAVDGPGGRTIRRLQAGAGWVLWIQ